VRHFITIAAIESDAWIGALATLTVGLVSAFVAWYVPAWRIRRTTRLETAEALRQTRDPLLRAAFDLQSRYYNIVARNFLSRYLENGSPDEQRYAIMSSLWIIGQYLGWVEILRREVQYLDLGSQSANRKLQLSLGDIATAMASDSSDDTFIIFRAEQRAIGEFMVTTRRTQSGDDRSDCLGYTEFLAGLEELRRKHSDHDSPSPIPAWAERLSHALDTAHTEADKARLVTVQRRLIHLVDLLDPDRVRYPELNSRGRLPRPASEPVSAIRIARFLWTLEAPWARVDDWACDCALNGTALSQAERIYRGRLGPTLRRPVIRIRWDGSWVSVEAFMSRHGDDRPLSGALRFMRGRKRLNALLESFDRPTLNAATVPARFIERVKTASRHMRAGLTIGGS
jgi:hypothetical protein